MKRNYLFVILGLIVFTGLVVYTSKAGFGQKKVETPVPAVSEKAGPSPEHEGHAKGSEQPKEQAEPQKSETAGEVPTVEIPPEKQQLIGVKTVVVSVKPLEKVIRTVGRVEYDERKLATINTKFEGWIEKLHVDYTGKYVKKGEPLAEIYSPELVATQQEFLNVLRWAKQGKDIKNENINKMLSKDAETIVEAAKQRLRLWDISEEQIRKIEDSGKPIRTLTLYSPVNGYVVQKMAIKGMRVMPGEKLFDIADLSSVWIISDIYEYELPIIKAGQTAKITLSYFPGKEFSSRVDYVYPTLAGETRTAKVRFTIPNPGGQLKPQMFTNVEMKILLGKRLAIPDDAVIDTGTRQIVYVDKGEGLFEPREVMLGVRAEGFREVLMGLKAGEKVASAATFLIDSEAQLKGVKPLGGHKH
jgi:Cu(I)/Ag(I) efflux system membrane fusion protein